jgi:hypothetical protein
LSSVYFLPQIFCLKSVRESNCNHWMINELRFGAAEIFASREEKNG